jgi:hypothetical protein
MSHRLRLEGCRWHIDAQHRGRGYGCLLLSEAEKQARRQGARTMGLHVFGTNKVARALYESAGYEVAQLDMRKLLVDSPNAARGSETRPLTPLGVGLCYLVEDVGELGRARQEGRVAAGEMADRRGH